MAHRELLVLVISSVWLMAGAAIGIRFGCFAAIGTGITSGLVGAALCAILLRANVFSRVCQRFANRFPWLAVALSRAEGCGIFAVWLALLLVPVIVQLVVAVR